ncbi:hypothetical protein F3J37_21755 [Pantoea sp. Al-1710]|uniref:Uncharacterized protein n=1 Tax=Candidatus Pantoea communis TaxID=2608354 RepID=A0ABX0RUT4_9GAMM|nr:hypothetical protein [Pantoea communis]NIG21301.1 hypothetical protein [Pantoea communis]
MRELSSNEMSVVAGGFSIGSCSIGGSFSTSKDGHGGSSTSGSFHAGCGLNAPDAGSSASGNNKGNSGKSSNKGQSSQRGGGKNR